VLEQLNLLNGAYNPQKIPDFVDNNIKEVTEEDDLSSDSQSPNVKDQMMESPDEKD